MRIFPIEKKLRQYSMVTVLVLLVAFFQFLTHNIFLAPQNVSNLIIQNSYILILAIGMTFCILSGGNVDLSVGSICSFIGALTGKLMLVHKFSVPTAIFVSLFVGILIGMWQGFWVSYLKIPSFIVTLAGMLVFRGLTILTLNGLTLGPFSRSFQSISGGFLSDFSKLEDEKKIVTWAISAVFLICCIIFKCFNKKNDSKTLTLLECFSISTLIYFLTLLLVRFKGTPIILLVLCLIYIIYDFVAKKTIFGRHVYAVGGNSKAAKCSGINVERVLFLVYVNMAFLASISGIVFSSRTNSASPQAGNGFELDAMAACYIGGASTTGGIGTIGGAVVGGLVMGVLNNGMSIMGIGSDVQFIIKGLALLLAVIFDTISKKHGQT